MFVYEIFCNSVSLCAFDGGRRACFTVLKQVVLIDLKGSRAGYDPLQRRGRHQCVFSLYDGRSLHKRRRGCDCLATLSDNRLIIVNLSLHLTQPFGQSQVFVFEVTWLIQILLNATLVFLNETRAVCPASSIVYTFILRFAILTQVKSAIFCIHFSRLNKKACLV